MMNQLRIILAASVAMTGLAFAVPSAAHPEHGTKTEEVRTIKIIKTDGDKEVAINSDSDKFVADCGKGRKFESSASRTDSENKKNVSKMVICSDPGESDADWAKTLGKALADVEGNKDMPADAKAQIVADLKSEIAKIGK
jgi:hypothetical protein